MRLFTANTERMRIDSSGNLLVGTTDTSPHTNNTGTVDDNGIALSNAGRLSMARKGATVALLNRTDNDGEILNFRKDGTTVGSIGTASTDLYLGSGVAGLRFREGGPQLMPWNTTTNAVNDNAIDIGKSDARFKDLYLSGGVYLGGTGSANKLDDYEEGTWTPQIGDVTGNTGTLTTAIGHYTKVGRQVTIVVDMINMDTTGLVSTEQVRIKNLPFSAFTSGGGPTFTSIAQTAGIGASGKTIIASIQDVFGYVRLKEADSGLSSYLDVSDITSPTADIRFSLTYFTDS